jgi:O-methyltransferase
MIKQAKVFLRRYLGNKLGYRPDFSLEREVSLEEKQIIKAVSPYTFTGFERLVALFQAVRHISERNIPGDIVECGVWRGGSMMAVALALKEIGETDRELYLFDTYEEIPDPTSLDVDILGRTGSFLHERAKERNKGVPAKTASLQEVKQNILSTGYPEDKIHFIKGKVEETIPCSGLSQIALLRLDTDYYESTLHELNHLFPILSIGGALIIDDYGHWQGAKIAVNEYFDKHQQYPIFLHRIDYTGRIAIKCSRSE